MNLKAIDDVKVGSKAPWEVLKQALDSTIPLQMFLDNVLLVIYAIENAFARNDIIAYTLDINALDDPLQKETFPLRNIFREIPLLNFDYDNVIYTKSFVNTLKGKIYFHTGCIF